MEKSNGKQQQLQFRSESTTYLYDGLHLLYEYTGNGAPLAEYYTGNDQVIARKMFGLKGRKDQGREGNLRTRGNLLYYGYDALGNVTDLMDHLGNPVTAYRYDAFGSLFTGTTVPYNALGYTGKQYDPKAGLVDFGARWYDPLTGRFTQADAYRGSVSTPASLNRYVYAYNDPINRFDPWGYQTLYKDKVWFDVIDVDYYTVTDVYADTEEYTTYRHRRYKVETWKVLEVWWYWGDDGYKHIDHTDWTTDIKRKLDETWYSTIVKETPAERAEKKYNSIYDTTGAPPADYAGKDIEWLQGAKMQWLYGEEQEPASARIAAARRALGGSRDANEYNVYVPAAGNPIGIPSPVGTYSPWDADAIDAFRDESSTLIKVGGSAASNVGVYAEATYVYTPGQGWSSFTTYGAVAGSKGASANVSIGKVYNLEKPQQMEGYSTGPNLTLGLINVGRDYMGTNSRGERIYADYVGVNYPFTTEWTAGVAAGVTTQTHPTSQISNDCSYLYPSFGSYPKNTCQ